MFLEKLTQNKMLISSLRKNLGLDEEDSSKDEKLLTMSEAELLERFLNWNNLIGWNRIILKTYDNLNQSASAGKINFERLSELDEGGDIVESLRQRGGFEDMADDFDEAEFVEYIQNLTVEDSFAEYLAWNGIIGFSEPITKAIISIREAKGL